MTKETSQAKIVFLDNDFIDENNAMVSPLQRGFLYGDGLFETCKFINNKIINFENHLDRFSKGAKFLGIKIPTKRNIEQICSDLIIRNKKNSGIIKIYASRGVGSFGYLPSKYCKTLLYIETKEVNPIPVNKSLILCDFNPPQFHFKTANSLPYILAKKFAHENGYFDSIMIDKEQTICETSSANIFWIKDQKIFTPSDSCDIIHGTVRKTLLSIEELKISRGKYDISSLRNADEVFITNSSFCLLPIEKIAFRDKKAYSKINFKKILVKKIFNLLKMKLGLI